MIRTSNLAMDISWGAKRHTQTIEGTRTPHGSGTPTDDFQAGAHYAIQMIAHEINDLRSNYDERVYPPITISESDRPNGASRDRWSAHSVRYALDILLKYIEGR
jgi:hypothetical protein